MGWPVQVTSYGFSIRSDASNRQFAAVAHRAFKSGVRTKAVNVVYSWYALSTIAVAAFTAAVSSPAYSGAASHRFNSASVSSPHRSGSTRRGEGAPTARASAADIFISRVRLGSLRSTRWARCENRAARAPRARRVDRPRSQRAARGEAWYLLGRCDLSALACDACWTDAKRRP